MDYKHRSASVHGTAAKTVHQVMGVTEPVFRPNDERSKAKSKNPKYLLTKKTLEDEH
jgi:hypothetical protein